jgi:hypothetical protein
LKYRLRAKYVIQESYREDVFPDRFLQHEAVVSTLASEEEWAKWLATVGSHVSFVVLVAERF